MGYKERKQLYRQHEELRNRPLISYVTSIRPGVSTNMAGDAITHIIKQVENIPSNQQELDFLILSNGGDPITSLRIVSILRERFEKISVIIPFVAYSAATVLALGADELIMHPYSNLGPVDPQITISSRSDNGRVSKKEFSTEDISNYINFVKSDVGITDQAHLISAFHKLADDVGPIPIGKSKRSQQLSLSLSKKMLESHMEDKNKAATIAKALNSSFYHHGYAVSRTEAENIGLNVITPGEAHEKLMWDIWQDFCDEMKCEREFNLVAEIMSNDAAKLILSSAPIISLPANTPKDTAAQLITRLATANAKIVQQNPIVISQLIASIESISHAVSVVVNYNIIYWRNANMELSFNATHYSEGWKPYVEKEIEGNAPNNDSAEPTTDVKEVDKDE